MIHVTHAKLYAAETDRWPGYADWVRKHAGAVDADGVWLSPKVRELLQAEVARRSPPPIPLTPARMVHGAVGIAKAITGQGGASAELIAARLAICHDCEHGGRPRGLIGKCGLCRCVVAAKARIASEECPAGRWVDGVRSTSGGGSTAG